MYPPLHFRPVPGHLSARMNLAHQLWAVTKRLFIRSAGAFICFSLSATLTVAAGRNPPPPAGEAFASWLQKEKTFGSVAFTQPQALTLGLNLAMARAQEMRALMEQNPAEFVAQ